MGAIPLCVCPEMMQSVVFVLDLHVNVEKGQAMTVSHLYWDDKASCSSSPPHPKNILKVIILRRRLFLDVLSSRLLVQN